MAQNSSRGKEWDATRLKALDRDGWTCGYCGVALTKDRARPTSATVDHIIAKDNGGTDEMHNLLSSCFKCNRDKSNKTLNRVTWVNKKWLEHL
jgi:5-methylcytosine-specific restriction enzyme A